MPSGTCMAKNLNLNWPTASNKPLSKPHRIRAAMLQLLYSSTPTFPVGDVTDDEIFAASLANNPRQRITGFLARAEFHFFQYIEGPSEEIRTLFAKIEADPRNTKLKLKMQEEEQTRIFSDMRVGYFNLPDHIRQNKCVQEWGNVATNPAGAEFLSILSKAVARESRMLQRPAGFSKP